MLSATRLRLASTIILAVNLVGSAVAVAAHDLTSGSFSDVCCLVLDLLQDQLLLLHVIVLSCSQVHTVPVYFHTVAVFLLSFHLVDSFHLSLIISYTVFLAQIVLAA